MAGEAFAETAIQTSRRLIYPPELGFRARDFMRHDTPDNLFNHLVLVRNKLRSSPELVDALVNQDHHM